MCWDCTEGAACPDKNSEVVKQVQDRAPQCKVDALFFPQNTIAATNISTVTCIQERNEVRWRPGQETSFATHVRTESLSEANVLLKKVLATLLGLYGVPIVIRHPENSAPLAPPSLRPYPATY